MQFVNFTRTLDLQRIPFICSDMSRYSRTSRRLCIKREAMTGGRATPLAGANGVDIV